MHTKYILEHFPYKYLYFIYTKIVFKYKNVNTHVYDFLYSYLP